ncbi:MAG: hypothetical protein A3E78_02465 [Alphaproteobacteria bacterium RIFCSPHIGHO2_12_FULL_63_12]|nr:MAG: hypothetical protein A3E78_02465 [Alphaproteobacteria bacterium RIFCSPHIGHO2_12_FULL_63_12]
MKTFLSIFLAGCLVAGAAFAVAEPSYSVSRLERPAGILKSPAAHEISICRKDHEGLDLAAAEPIADAETRLKAALEAGGDFVSVDVADLSCAYCMAAIEKSFAAREEVAAAYLNPHNSTLSFVTEKGRSLDDELIRKLIKRRGYGVAAIRRGDFVSPAPEADEEAAKATTPQ